MRDYKLKSEVGYKITQGMQAVGSQCKDCRYALMNNGKSGNNYCLIVRALVKPNGTCRQLTRREDAE